MKKAEEVITELEKSGVLPDFHFPDFPPEGEYKGAAWVVGRVTYIKSSYRLKVSETPYVAYTSLGREIVAMIKAWGTYDEVCSGGAADE
jgi:hypothetical protein